MKMIGHILEYDEINALGYIEGYDGTVYMFHQIYVKDDIILKKGERVEFNFDISTDKDMPYAIDIERKEE